MAAKLVRQPLEIGRRVVVFTTDSTSQATLGYYGTIISVLSPKVSSDGTLGDYYYRVRVGDSVWVVAGDDLLRTGELDTSFENKRRILEIRYETKPTPINNELSGFFIFDGEVGYFRFRKRSQPTLTYHLHIPTAFSKATATVLDVNVPGWRILDHTLVLEVLSEVLIGQERIS